MYDIVGAGDEIMEIYQKIKWLRENADLKQKDMADMLKTTQQYYSEYENGKRKIPIEHLKTICLYFHISSDYLIGLPEGLSYPKRG